MTPTTLKTISFLLILPFVAGLVFAQAPTSPQPALPAKTFDGKDVYRQKLENNPFKPCVDVLCVPSGGNILRDSPWDHLHHHALMFAVGVNGVDFWGEFDDTRGKQLVTRASGKTCMESDDTGFQKAVFRDRTSLDWVIPDGTVVLKETRNISVLRRSDFDVTLLTWHSQLATPDSGAAAALGGDHYYGLGLRFDESMDQNGRFFAGIEDDDRVFPGEVVRGDERLTSCKWMAYTAKLHDQPVTVAVFDFPNNPRPMLAFTMGDAGGAFAYISATVNLFRDPLELTKDKPLDFVYGVAVWDGEQTAETVESIYQQWLATSSSSLPK
ncbi:MAG: PmoA family protein [Planctomycetaceae bacterium]|nr:PmoA family protein [Planctomycetaceae bacterium]